MLRPFFTLFLLVVMSSIGFSGSPQTTYRLDVAENTGQIAGNGITDIKASDRALWFGTGNGLSRTLDQGRHFQSLGSSDGLPRGSISALWVQGDSLWVAAASDTLTSISDSPLTMGTGLAFSADHGSTWRRLPQPGETPVQNVTYDLAVFQGTVWITSFGGGIRRSDDWGETWDIAPPDTFVFNPGRYLNHRGFSAEATSDAIWIGTAGGINKSMDNGETWTNFNHTNQQDPISGNFVVALAHQVVSGKTIIWAATWKAEGENEFYGVSRSDNGGASWETFLAGEKAHNFAFDQETVYVPTDNGVFVSEDQGETWYVIRDITDNASGDRLLTTEMYSAYGRSDTLWVGSADGLARTADNGYSWSVFRAFRSTAQEKEPRTYAYPNPFSPNRHNLIDNDGHVRLQFNTLNPAHVSIHVYDYAMDLVKTVEPGRVYQGPGDFSALWNGRNEYGDAVANGVYFYSVDIENDGTYWGKIIVLN
jgi:hypothetical protein